MNKLFKRGAIVHEKIRAEDGPCVRRIFCNHGAGAIDHPVLDIGKADNGAAISEGTHRIITVQDPLPLRIDKAAIAAGEADCGKPLGKEIGIGKRLRNPGRWGRGVDEPIEAAGHHPPPNEAQSVRCPFGTQIMIEWGQGSSRRITNELCIPAQTAIVARRDDKSIGPSRVDVEIAPGGHLGSGTIDDDRVGFAELNPFELNCGVVARKRCDFFEIERNGNIPIEVEVPARPGIAVGSVADSEKTAAYERDAAVGIGLRESRIGVVEDEFAAHLDSTRRGRSRSGSQSAGRRSC